MCGSGYPSHLGVGHGARLEPAVKHFRDTLERRLAGAGRGDGEVVNAVTVEVGHFLPRESFQLLDAADTHHLEDRDLGGDFCTG